ncbi:MAG: winged helix-turn-helix transcriptional regulator, partial [Candidatus Omnitrophica bacterium]|nr:winged helix-turn-helix transcriptional regulator [Candidatus Omnitrophota bacterium]
MKYNLDKCDYKILGLIQKDSSITNKELAKKIKLSPAATLSRLNKLKKTGVIEKFTAILDEKKLDYNIST